MSTRNLAIVGVRLLAIYCFVQSIVQSNNFLTLFDFMTTGWGADTSLGAEAATLGLASLPGVSLLLLAVFLFVFSVPIARRLTPAESAGVAETVCTFEELQAIAFAAAGILILATALPNVGRAVEGLLSLYRSRQQGGAIDARGFRASWLYSLGLIAQLLAGLVLLLNPRGCRNVWHWLRTAGT